MNKKCIVCGNEILLSDRSPANRNSCSSECAAKRKKERSYACENRKRALLGIAPINPRPPKPVHACIVCGESFIASGKFFGKKTCSDYCFERWLTHRDKVVMMQEER